MSRKTLLIFLHGSGGRGSDIQMVLGTVPLTSFGNRTFCQIAEMASIDIITPTAPERPYSPAYGDWMNVWFDRTLRFHEEGLGSKEDTDGVNESVNMIREIIEEKKDLYKSIFVGGFSMGGGLTLHLARFDLPANVLGIFSMGSFLVEGSAVFTQPLKSGCRLPYLMMHGTADDLIFMDWGRKTAAAMTVLNMDVQFKEYADVYHDIGDEMLEDLFHWMQDIIETVPNGNLIADAATSPEVEAVSVGSKIRRLDPEQCSADASSNTVVAGGETVEPMEHALAPVPYSVALVPGSTTEYKIVFAIPPDMVDIAIERPVLVRGGMFELKKKSANAIEMIATTTDPEGLAVDVGKRLLSRLADGNTRVNPCPMA